MFVFPESFAPQIAEYEAGNPKSIDSRVRKF
jgi:hypothetical protein